MNAATPNDPGLDPQAARFDDEQAKLSKSSSASGGSEPAAAGAERYKQSLQRRGTGGESHDTEIWKGGYSAKAMIGQWLAALLLTLVSMIGVIFFGLAIPFAWLVWFGLTLVLWISLWFIYLYRRWTKTYRLTSQRFVHESGLLKRVTDRIEVIDIDDVSFEQGLIQRMLGVGSIRISSSDRSHPELWLRGIDQVREVAGKIDDTRRAERERRGVYVESV